MTGWNEESPIFMIMSSVGEIQFQKAPYGTLY